MEVICPDKELLQKFANADLTEEQMVPLEDHLDLCESCMDFVDTFVREQSAFGLQVAALIPGVRENAETADARQEVTRAAVTDGKKASARPHDQNVAETLSDPASPELVIARHVLKGHIGRGGMGEVYLAEHVELGTCRAIKLLHPDRRHDRESILRFQRETRVSGRLDHRNLVRTIDAGEETGLQYLVMEFVDGIDLRSCIRTNGILSVANACQVIVETAQALQVMAQSDLIHRDIKPSNIMLDRTGSVRLLDYGLSRIARAGDTGETLTHELQVLGSPAYMAPELFRGARAASVKADIYSLGCTLFFLLTGKPPYEMSGGDILKLADLHAAEKIPDVRSVNPDVPDALANFLITMLAPRPEHRCKSPDAVMNTLLPFARESRLADVIAEFPTPELRPIPDTLRNALRPSVPENRAAEQSPTKEFPPTKGRKWLNVRRFATWLVGASLLLAMVQLTGKSDVTVTSNGQPVKIEIDGVEQQFQVAASSESVQVTTDNGRHRVRVKFADGQDLEREIWVLRFGSNRLELSVNETPAGKVSTADQSSPVNEITNRQLPPLIPQPRMFAPGEPLSRAALVQRPAKIPGVLSWTIETKTPRGIVTSLRVSKDGKLLAAGSSDGVIRFYDMPGFKLRNVLIGHSAINSMRWASESHLLVADAGGIVRLWDVTNNAIVTSWDNGRDMATDAAAAPDGSSITICESGADINVAKYDPHTKSFLPTEISKIDPYAWTNCWSPDGRIHAVGDHERLRLYRPDAIVPFAEFETAGRITELEFSSSGRWIAAGVKMKSVLLVDLEAPKEAVLITDTKGPERGIAWSPDGKRLAASGAISLRIEDTVHPDASVSHRPGFPYLSALAWIDNERIIYCDHTASGVRQMNATDGSDEAALMTANGPASFLFANDSASGVSAIIQDTRITVSDDALEIRHDPDVASTRSVIVATDPSNATVYLGRHHELLVVDNSGEVTICKREDFHWATQIGGIAVRDGRPTLVIFWDGQIHQYDPDSGELNLLEQLPAAGKREFAIEYSPSGERILVQMKNTLRVYKSGSDLQELWSQEYKKVDAPHWSPDEKSILFTNTPTRCEIVDAENGKPLGQLLGPHHWESRTAIWSPDSQYVAGTGDAGLFMWDAKRWNQTWFRPCNVCKEHGRSVAYSTDGGAVWLGTNDRVLRRFDANNGRPLETVVVLDHERYGRISDAGQLAATESLIADLVFVIETSEGQHTLSPEEFRKLSGNNVPPIATLRP